MVNTSLCIKSDFVDYYDNLSSNTGIIYNRMISDVKQRGSALRYLRSLGVKTLDIKQVSNFSYLDGDLVVYTDSKKHHGNGKKIMSYEEALTYYSNYPASIYLEDSKGITIKVLQIGQRRFNLTFKKEDKSLTEGKLIGISEMAPAFNMLIGLPIFSIDYVASGCEMIATDFNEVENLSRIGINNYISSDDVCKEIINSLYAYNKVERN